MSVESAPAPAVRTATRSWGLAAGLALLTSLVVWLLVVRDLQPERLGFVVFAAAIAIWIHLAGNGRESRRAHAGPDRRTLLVSLAALAGAASYAIGVPQQPAGQYHLLSVLHLPVFAWLMLGWVVVGLRSAPQERFAAIQKSIDVVVTGGVFGVGGAIFAVITANLLDVINVSMPRLLQLWLHAGLPALIPVLAVASIYDPHVPPSEQQPDLGASRLVSTAARIFMPLTLLTLVAYVVLIPFNFWKAFLQRDVLIVYNIMLFAVMVLLTSAAPRPGEKIHERLEAVLRGGSLAVAVLSVLVGLYALAAVLYRTSAGGWTPNRVTVVGWDAINVALLISFVTGTLRNRDVTWRETLSSTAGGGAVLYFGWTLIVLLVLPWMRVS